MEALESVEELVQLKTRVMQSLNYSIGHWHGGESVDEPISLINTINEGTAVRLSGSNNSLPLSESVPLKRLTQLPNSPVLRLATQPSRGCQSIETNTLTGTNNGMKMTMMTSSSHWQRLLLPSLQQSLMEVDNLILQFQESILLHQRQLHSFSTITGASVLPAIQESMNPNEAKKTHGDRDTATETALLMSQSLRQTAASFAHNISSIYGESTASSFRGHEVRE